jgi:hypothetical protein
MNEYDANSTHTSQSNVCAMKMIRKKKSLDFSFPSCNLKKGNWGSRSTILKKRYKRESNYF